jgi:hypothetical protein
MLLTFLAVIAVIFAVVATSGDPGSDVVDPVEVTDQPTTLLAPSPAPTTSRAPPSTTMVLAPTTATAATAAPATAAQTTTVATATSTVPVVTGAPTTLAPAAPPPTTLPPATLPPNGPVVTIIGRVGPCRFGSECLLAGFTIHNFDTQPTEFVCEFADGSRYTFDFNRQEVERACATGDPDDTITIEVDGVRSATYRGP